MARATHWFVYVVTNTRNGKVYIGKAADPRARWASHRSRARRGYRSAISSTIHKYGEGAFRFEVMAGFRDERDAFAFERDQIHARRSNVRAFGYNLTDGGEGASGTVVSLETRWKLSAAHAGRKLWSEEQKRRIAERLTGHAVSGRTRDKIREARKRQTNVRPFSDEARASARKKNPTIRGLSNDDARTIRELYAARSSTGRALASTYGVTATMISRIVRGRAFVTAGGPIVVERFRNNGPMSDEHKAKLSNGRERTAYTPEANAKRRRKMVGRKMSDAAKQKIRDSWIERRARSNAE